MSAPPVAAPSNPTITQPAYHGVVVDSRYIPATSLLTHVQGAAWTVNYYSQVIAGNSQLSGQQVTLDPSLQQYKLIKKLELRVTQDLTTSQDTTTNAMIVTGAALVYPPLIPNVGDMFLADVGDGKEGVFQLTNVEKKTIYQDSCYQVEYKLIDYATPERLGDLKAKTVENLNFVRDFLDHGQNPIITDDDFTLSAHLVDRFHRLLPRWCKEHLNTEFMAFTVPGQERAIYDPFLAKFINAVFSSSDCHDLSRARVLNVDDDFAMKAYCLWDALLNQERGLMMRGFKKAGLVTTQSFTNNPMLEGIRFSGIDSVIYPKDPDRTVNFPSTADLKTMEDDWLTDPQPSTINLTDLLQDLNLDTQDTAPPIIKPTVSEDYYVFSQAFYEKAASGQSLLELSVQRYLDGKSLNGHVLRAIVDSTGAWGSLERFYFIPITLVLIRAFVRGL
jgi:hypothetical protein